MQTKQQPIHKALDDTKNVNMIYNKQLVTKTDIIAIVFQIFIKDKNNLHNSILLIFSSHDNSTLYMCTNKQELFNKLDENFLKWI